MALTLQTVMIAAMRMRSFLISGFFIALCLPAGGIALAQGPADGPAMKALPAPEVIATPAGPPQNPGPGDGLVFLELYTAEHCAFCPTAERIFSDILTGENVIGLTCVVDYFDSGTPSLLSRPFCKDQQQVYSRMMRTGSLYTPQLVVNGAEQLPGHNLLKITDTIRQARISAARPEELLIEEGALPGDYDVRLPAIRPDPDRPDEKFILRIIMLKREPDLSAVISQQQRRERAPSNTATALIEGGLWDGRKTVWTIKPPAADSANPVSDAFLVLVQDRDDGRVLAVGQHILNNL